MLGTSCGDIFESKTHISGNYYLVKSDTKDNITISYKISQGDYIGRISPKVQEYAIIGDSLIVGKRLEKSLIQFYIVRIKRDSEYAEKRDYLIEPMDASVFDSIYTKKGKIEFIKAY